jgi:outer membrane immunogenic protein
MIRTVTIALLCTTAAAGAAHAGSNDMAPADPVVYTPAAQPAQPFWEGGYVGAQLGYAYGEFDLNGNFDSDSVIGGLTAGYMWNLGNDWYAGPELQYDRADVSVTDPGTGSTATFKEMARLKAVVGKAMGNGLR